jgi:GPH family glycoside/pentoside/hexuronide:cation symporter
MGSGLGGSWGNYRPAANIFPPIVEFFSAFSRYTSVVERYDRPRIGRARLVNYSLPVLAIEFVIYPVLAILPSFYVSFSGGELASYATAILISRLVYSCSGPIVGYLSDRFATPWGRRKPWMIVGTVVEVVSVYLVFNPPAHAGPNYFAWTGALALFGFSMIDVPYIAWGSEITRDYATRSLVASYRAVFAVCGQVVFLALPLLPAFGGKNLLDPRTIAHLGFMAILLLIVTMSVAMLWGPQAQAEETAPVRTSVFRILIDMVRNLPMVYLAGATVFTFLAYSVQLTIGLQFMASIGFASTFGPLTLAGLVLSILSVPLWELVTKRIGKHKTWALTLAVTFVGLPAYFVVAQIFGTLPALIASAIVVAFPSAYMTASLPYSIMGDVIDYDELKTRSNRSANYAAIVLLLIRLQVAIGGAIAFAVLGAMRFEVHATNARALQPAMVVAYFVVPGVFLLLALACAWSFPIDARRAAIVRRRLEIRGNGVR